jgi:hypothetical protein
MRGHVICCRLAPVKSGARFLERAAVSGPESHLHEHTKYVVNLRQRSCKPLPGAYDAWANHNKISTLYGTNEIFN